MSNPTEEKTKLLRDPIKVDSKGRHTDELKDLSDSKKLQKILDEWHRKRLAAIDSVVKGK